MKILYCYVPLFPTFPMPAAAEGGATGRAGSQYNRAVLRALRADCLSFLTCTMRPVVPSSQAGGKGCGERSPRLVKRPVIIDAHPT